MDKRILIVEDDTAFGVMLEKWFARNHWQTTLTSKVTTAIREIDNNQYELIISDLRLPDGDGIMLLTHVKGKNITTPFIIMTGYADVQTAVNAMKLGAYDYLKKPINPEILQQKIDAAMKAQHDERHDVKSHSKNSENCVVKGESAVIQRVYSHVALVAPTNMSVLILGESGTGKEYVAKMIHEQSQRRNKPYIAVDCGSLSKELAPSELFGHLKGSFTSAVSDKRGVFEEAKGGTVFLDEIGNLPYDVQKQLLRTLQEHKVRPVGSARDVDIDVRIVAATNENLLDAIEDGAFRQDLYHRINEFTIEMPPLRERLEDLEEFAYHFLNQANAELGKNVTRICDDVFAVLRKQQWSGNLRELRNVIRRAALFAENQEITVEHLPVFAQVQSKNVNDDMALRPGNEKEQIVNALNKARGNKTVAARLLQIDRKTLYNKMHLYEINL